MYHAESIQADDNQVAVAQGFNYTEALATFVSQEQIRHRSHQTACGHFFCEFAPVNMFALTSEANEVLASYHVPNLDSLGPKVLVQAPGVCPTNDWKCNISPESLIAAMLLAGGVVPSLTKREMPYDTFPHNVVKQVHLWRNDFFFLPAIPAGQNLAWTEGQCIQSVLKDHIQKDEVFDYRRNFCVCHSLFCNTTNVPYTTNVTILPPKN
jgi:hypothetical protein